MSISNRGFAYGGQSFGGKMMDFIFRKGVVFMQEMQDLIRELAELVKRLNELLVQIEYIAIKRIKK